MIENDINRLLETLVRQAVEKEREECAKLCEGYWHSLLDKAPEGTFLTSNRKEDKAYSKGLLDSAKGSSELIRMRSKADFNTDGSKFTMKAQQPI